MVKIGDLRGILSLRTKNLSILRFFIKKVIFQKSRKVVLHCKKKKIKKKHKENPDHKVFVFFLQLLYVQCFGSKKHFFKKKRAPKYPEFRCFFLKKFSFPTVYSRAFNGRKKTCFFAKKNGSAEIRGKKTKKNRPLNDDIKNTPKKKCEKLFKRQKRHKKKVVIQKKPAPLCLVLLAMFYCESVISD